jgi:hypothetical protein
LAIGALPVVNAVFDYVSYGVTLSLLRAGRREDGWPPLLCGLLDALGAVLILYGLALALALYIAAINALGSVPFLPLDRLFEDLADPAVRSGYAWLYLTLLSTLVPTGVHLLLALISVTTLLPAQAKRWFIDRITDESSDLATLLGTTAFALFIAVSLVGLAWVLWQGGSWVLDHFDDSAVLLLAAVEATMRALGLV